MALYKYAYYYYFFDKTEDSRQDYNMIPRNTLKMLLWRFQLWVTDTA